jgi:hypothetical protein
MPENEIKAWIKDLNSNTSFTKLDNHQKWGHYCSYFIDSEGKLKTFNAAGAGLKDFSNEDWEKLKDCEFVDLSENSFSSLEITTNLPYLKYLSINRNKIKFTLKINKTLKNLQYLYVHKSNLTNIEIQCDLPRLEQLNLSENKELLKLELWYLFSGIEELNIKECNVGRLILPLGWFQGESKVSLKLAGNSLDPVLLEYLKISEEPERSEKLRKYFDQFSVEKPKNINEQDYVAKVIFLGNTGVGKTSLYDCVKKTKLQVESTHGINLFTHTFKYEVNNGNGEVEKQTITVQGFDFGGQDYYHNTHYTFFNNVNAYFLMWGKNQPDTLLKIPRESKENGKIITVSENGYPMNYWLGSIKYFDPSQSLPTTVLFQNLFCSENNSISAPKRLDEFTLTSENNYPNIRVFHSGILKEGTPGVSDIKKWFEEIVAENKTTESIPPADKTLYKKIDDELKKRILIPKNEIAKEFGIQEKEVEEFLEKAHTRFQLFYLGKKKFGEREKEIRTEYLSQVLSTIENFMFAEFRLKIGKKDDADNFESDDSHLNKKITGAADRKSNIYDLGNDLLSSLTFYKEELLESLENCKKELIKNDDTNQIQLEKQKNLENKKDVIVKLRRGLMDDLYSDYYLISIEELVKVIGEKSDIGNTLEKPEYVFKRIESIINFEKQLKQYVIIDISTFSNLLYIILKKELKDDGYFGFDEAKMRLFPENGTQKGNTETVKLSQQFTNEEDRKSVTGYILHFMLYHKIIFRVKKDNDKDEDKDKQKFVAPAYLPDIKTIQEKLFVETFDEALVKFEFREFFHTSLLSEILTYFLDYVAIDLQGEKWKYLLWKNTIVLYDEIGIVEKENEKYKPKRMLCIQFIWSDLIDLTVVTDPKEADKLERKIKADNKPLVTIEIKQHSKFAAEENFYLRVVNTIEQIVKRYKYQKWLRSPFGKYIPAEEITHNCLNEKGERTPYITYDKVLYRVSDFKLFLTNKKDYPMKKIFISYSKSDYKYLQQLKNHLSALKREGVIDVWTDNELVPGAHWDAKIKDEISSADVVLFLVSSDFLACDYIWEEEIPLALKKEDKNDNSCVPIIVRACDWESTVLGKFNTAPAKAIVLSTAPDIDTAWKEAVVELKKILKP